jgi:YggT family protein
VSYALVNLISILFQVYEFLILVEVIGSWIMAARVRLPDWAFGALSAIHRITAPVLEPIRRLIPSIGGLDFSPIIALILLDLLRSLIVRLLLGVL